MWAEFEKRRQEWHKRELEMLRNIPITSEESIPIDWIKAFHRIRYFNSDGTQIGGGGAINKLLEAWEEIKHETD